MKKLCYYVLLLLLFTSCNDGDELIMTMDSAETLNIEPEGMMVLKKYLTMKLKIILTTLLISGALSSCFPDEVDYIFEEEHIYINKTNHSVTIHCDSIHSANGILLSCDWNIEPNCSIVIHCDSLDCNQFFPSDYDSVMVKFDDGKSLMVGLNESILRNDSIERVSPYFARLYHFITVEMYDSAKFTAP